MQLGRRTSRRRGRDPRQAARRLGGDAVSVALGSRATTSWWHAPKGTPPQLVTNFLRGKSRLDTIVDGDDVVVSGKLARDGDTWKMSPETGVITATAVNHAVRAAAMSPVAIVVTLGIATALRQYRNDITTYKVNGPFRLLDDLVLYRDTSRLAGDTADAAAWDAIIDRHVKMLSDRDRAIGMVLWKSFD